MINETDGVFGRALSPLNRKLLEKMFTDDDESRLGLTASLRIPVVGIGAPASNFYPPIAQFMDAEIVVPEHAEVANAIGAVVGEVRQSAQITITPIAGNKRVVVHAPQTQREFDDLELAAAWATEVATELAQQKATSAGGSGLQVTVDRSDNCLLYTSPSPRDGLLSRMPSSA